MVPARRFSLPLLAALALVLSLSSEALATGGTPRYKHDNSGFDGWCTLFANGLDGNRWNVRYNAHELDPGAVICQGHAWFFNFQTKTDPTSPNFDPSDLYVTMDLRAEDPAAPGYPDLSPAGVLAAGGRFLAGPGAYRHIYQTFNLPVDSTQTIFLSWSEPFTVATGGAVCTMIDVHSPDTVPDSGSSNDSVWRTADGATGYEPTYDYIGEAIVFEPKQVDLRLNVRGSQRWPGDHGAPVVFARRNAAGAQPTDDFISVDIVVDNAGASPVNGDVRVEVDRAVFAGGSGVWTNITRFFVPKIVNPVALAPGRTILSARIPQALKDNQVRLLPRNVPMRVMLTDHDALTLLDSEPGVWGLRPVAGFVDAGTDDSAYIVRSPAFTNDEVAVRFAAADLPRSAPFILSGLQVAGIEVGGSGLAGFDAVEFRAEDPVLQTPDLSPSGLIRGVGTRDGIGEVPLGGPGGFVVNRTIDFLDTFLDPTAGPTYNYWVEVVFRPGDTATLGTLLMFDNQASTRFPYTFYKLGDGDGSYRRRDDFSVKNFNAEVRLELDNRDGTLDDGGIRVTDRKPRYVQTMVDPVPQILRTGESPPR